MTKIGQAMALSAPAGWQHVSLHVTAVYSMMETALTVTMQNGTVDKSRSIVDVDEALLRGDQERFPREAELLPAWHPSAATDA